MLKRSIKRDEFHLVLVKEAISKIEDFLKNVKYHRFMEDELIFSAISMQLAVIGERIKS